jgi:hypothetical protein
MRAGNYCESEWAPGLALTVPAVGSQGGRRFTTQAKHLTAESDSREAVIGA